LAVVAVVVLAGLVLTVLAQLGGQAAMEPKAHPMLLVMGVLALAVVRQLDIIQAAVAAA
jgi:VIT1/CCC1 family predicted Fe2+/Mn2+ transporter